MKLAAILFALLTFAAELRAEWVLDGNTPRSAPDGITFSQRGISGPPGGAELSVVSFSPKTHAFAVMDNPDGDYDLGSACAKRGALAGVNGGYFQPDRAPLGLVIRQGVQIHPLERSKLISGIISVTPTAVAIQRIAAFKPSPAVKEALQCGPFLVEAGKAITGLNETKSAARTVVFQNDKGRCGFLICKSASLADMAAILATPAIFPEGKIVRALNLDGGSSTALWVRGTPPFYAREWKSVRNYLAIVPR